MAETVRVDIPHKLTREQARQRIASGFDRIRSDATGGMVKFEDVWTCLLYTSPSPRDS